MRRGRGEGPHRRLTMQLARAPAGRERVCASAEKPAGSSTSLGGWKGEVQRKSVVSMAVQRSMGELVRAPHISVSWRDWSRRRRRRTSLALR